MAIATITFETLIQDSQDFGRFEPDEAHVVSKICFSMDIGDRHFGGLSVEVRHPYGTDFESEPFEVSPVSGYRGPWNHARFSDLAEQYYRGLVGHTVRIQGGNLRMHDNLFPSRQQVHLEIPDEACGAW
jgi:hypothetical protein